MTCRAGYFNSELHLGLFSREHAFWSRYWLHELNKFMFDSLFISPLSRAAEIARTYSKRSLCVSSGLLRPSLLLSHHQRTSFDTMHTRTFIYLTDTSWSHRFASRVYTKAQTDEPAKLAKRSWERLLEAWKGDGGDGKDGGIKG